MKTTTIAVYRALGMSWALTVVACASAERSDVMETPGTSPAAMIPKPNTAPELDALIAVVDHKVEQAGNDEVGDEITHARTEGIPMELNEDVERWIEYFTVKDRERFQRFMERGEKYRPMIAAVLRDQGIPTEVYYQAMIESGFATHATSHAQAVGIWQFIKGTGTRYGLRIDRYVDERRDPMRATIAAALYMKDLYNVFQDWYLAMAAYNAGEGRIMGAIMRSKTRDFWEMVRRRALPPETMNYIPKFIAATTIGHNPGRYGFDDLRPELMPTLASVTVPSSLRLSDIAKVTRVSLATLKSANPHLLRGMTPPGSDSYRLWVPKDQVSAFVGKEAQLAARRIKVPASVASSRSVGGTYHRVSRGDTLFTIARRYGTDVATLKRLNGMRSNRILAGTRLKVRDEPAVKSYRVRRGDNLNVIAKRFGLSVNELKRLNRLKRNTIYVGQTLKVGAGRG